MMDEQFKLRKGESPMERSLSFLSLVGGLKENMTSDEIDGLASMVYPELGDNLRALIELESCRGPMIFTFSKLAQELQSIVDAKDRGDPIIYAPIIMNPDLWKCFDPPLYAIQGDIAGLLECLLLTDQADRNIDFAQSLGFEPGNLCPAPFTNLASMIMSWEWFKPDVIATNATGLCAGNPLAFSTIANLYDVPMIFTERPNERADSKRGREYNYQGTERLIKRFEEWTGSKFSTEKLREATKISIRQRELWYEYYELRKHKPVPHSNMSWIPALAARTWFWGTQDGIEIFEKLIEKAEERIRTGGYEEVVRLTQVQGPFFYDTYGSLVWAEKQGIFVMGHVAEMGNWSNPEPIDLDSRESMVRAMANLVYDNGMLMHFGSSTMVESWVEDIERDIRALDLDGVINACNKSCQTAYGISNYVKRRVMEDTGVPMLIQYGDYFDRREYSMAQWRDEVTTFVNDIILPKKAKLAAKTKAAKTG